MRVGRWSGIVVVCSLVVAAGAMAGERPRQVRLPGVGEGHLYDRSNLVPAMSRMIQLPRARGDSVVLGDQRYPLDAWIGFPSAAPSFAPNSAARAWVPPDPSTPRIGAAPFAALGGATRRPFEAGIRASASPPEAGRAIENEIDRLIHELD